MRAGWEEHLRGKQRGWGVAKHDEEIAIDLKELEQHDLGGGITLRKVLPVGGMFKHGRLIHDRAFWLVSLVWEGEQVPATPAARAHFGPGGLQEVRIFPPRPEDGPHGAGWLVTEWAGPAGQQGVFDTFEAARDAVLADLRQFDASRRLGYEDPPGA